MLTTDIQQVIKPTLSPLDTFAKLFNVGYRKVLKDGDEWRGLDLDFHPKMAADIIKRNKLPLIIERNNSLNLVKGFIVKEA